MQPRRRLPLAPTGARPRTTNRADEGLPPAEAACCLSKIPTTTARNTAGCLPRNAVLLLRAHGTQLASFRTHTEAHLYAHICHACREHAQIAPHHCSCLPAPCLRVETRQSVNITLRALIWACCLNAHHGTAVRLRRRACRQPACAMPRNAGSLPQPGQVRAAKRTCFILGQTTKCPHVRAPSCQTTCYLLPAIPLYHTTAVPGAQMSLYG